MNENMRFMFRNNCFRPFYDCRKTKEHLRLFKENKESVYFDDNNNDELLEKV